MHYSFCRKRFSLAEESELGAVLRRHKAFISNSAYYTLLKGAAGKPARESDRLPTLVSSGASLQPLSEDSPFTTSKETP